MEKENIGFREDGIKTFVTRFKSILEKSDYNLNQFVKGNSLDISQNISEELACEIKEFMDDIPELFIQIENKDEIWDFLEQIKDYENNNKFVKWLIKYADAIMRPYEDAAFLKKLSDEEFKKISSYCFYNLILTNIEKKDIDKIWDEEQILILRKIMFTFIDMIVISNYSKESAFSQVKNIFGIGKDYCEVWWKFIEENEEKLWRIMISKRINRLENKIECVLENIHE